MAARRRFSQTAFCIWMTVNRLLNRTFLPALSLGLCLSAAGVVADPAPAPATPPAAEAPGFDIWEFRVEGNTVLDQRVIEKTVYGYLGPGRGVSEVEKAREALEKAYHEAGYQTVFVDIPEQDVEGGVVRLNVTEGKVGRLQVTGSRYFSLGRIREGTPALAEGTVPHMPTVQKQLTALSEQSADRGVTPVLRAGSTPGTLEAELKVNDELPLHGSVEMNSRNTINTSYTRMVAQVRYDNLWQRFHSASLQYQTSPENADEVEVWAGTYAMPIGEYKTQLVFYGVGVNSSTPITTAGALSVVGTGEIFGARVVQPFATTDSQFHSVMAGFDHKSFEQNLLLTGSDTDQTPITYVPFMAQYDGSQKWLNGATSWSLGSVFHFRGMGDDESVWKKKRSTAKSDFVYFTGELKHRQDLPGEFLAMGRVGGQWTGSPLISNEQFSLGGTQTVRGYHETEVLGDNGYNVSLELFSPKLTPDAWPSLQNLRALAFGDYGKTWIREASPDEPKKYELASAGAGLRFQLLKHFIGEFDWAYPFLATDNTRVGAQRIHFKVAYEF